MNLRDTFFTDSFFKSNWGEFEKFQESLKLRYNIFLDTFLEIPLTTSNENKFCSLITENYQDKNKIEKQIRQENKDEQSQEAKLSLHMDKTNLQSMDTKFDKFSPRRWMLPMFSKLDLENNFNIDHSRNVISYKDDQNVFELKLDISEYEPEEVKVTVSPDGILVEGNHEEKSMEGKQNLYKSFTRKYSLPHGVRQEDVISKFATNHVLIISAKKEILHSEQIRIKDQSKDVSIANTSRNSELNVKDRENRAATQKEVSSCKISSESIQDEDHSSRNVKIKKDYRTNESSKIEVHSKLEEEKSTFDEKRYRNINIDHQKDTVDKLDNLTSSSKGVPIKVEPFLKTNNANITNIDIKYDTKDLQASKEMTTSAKYECDRNIDINVSKSYTHTNDQSALKSQNVSKTVNIELESEELEPEKSKEKVKSNTFDDTSRVAKDENYLCSQVKNESMQHSDLSATSKTSNELTQIQVNHQTSPKTIKKNVTKTEGNNSSDMIWGLPSIKIEQLDLFQNKDNQVINVEDNQEKFEVSLDTSQ
jgi:HSP20 family molecular chaperone IbpA